MNWLAWGGGAAALVAAGAALWFFGLGGVAKVLRSIFGALGDAAAWLRGWLQRPGNKTRGLCAVFAAASLCAGLQSWQRGTVIVQQRADYVALKDTTDAEKRTLSQQIADREATIATFTALAARQKQLLAQAALDNAAALALAYEAQREAAESEAKYQDAFLKRPPECKAALEVMAAACPALEGY